MKLNKLLCKIFGHKPRVVEKYYSFGTFTRSRCTRCNNETYHKVLDNKNKELDQLPNRIIGFG